MKITTISALASPSGKPRPAWLSAMARHAVQARLRRLQYGELLIVDGNDRQRFGGRTEDFPLSATIFVHDQQFYADIAFGGSIGAGEAYMQRHWTCDDLTTVVRVLVRNRKVLDNMEEGLARLAAPLRKIFHWLHRNTKDGSRHNIAAHYDIGNELFALFLDDTMTYSCGIFEHANWSLQDASIAKLDRICKKLRLSADDHLLEIGSGWGSLALHAASQYGCRVTTTTISHEQYNLARKRVREAGLSDRIDVLLRDYRDLTGQYDKLVSVEMIEAVGHAYYDTFFERCSALLKPEGVMLLQAITIADQYYEQAKRSVDFIQRYIFPGSCIPSVTAMVSAVASATDMRLFHLEDIGPHYANTLRCWRERFFASIDRVRALGYPDSFIRMWEFYLCYCEGGFQERAIGDVQMLFTKPLNRRAPLLPTL